MSALAGVHTLGSQHGSNLGLVLSEPGNRGDGVGDVGQGDGLVLSDDQLLLWGELGQGAGHGSKAEENSYGLHLREREELQSWLGRDSESSYLVNITVNPLGRLY